MCIYQHTCVNPETAQSCRYLSQAYGLSFREMEINARPLMLSQAQRAAVKRKPMMQMPRLQFVNSDDDFGAGSRDLMRL